MALTKDKDTNNLNLGLRLFLVNRAISIFFKKLRLRFPNYNIYIRNISNPRTAISTFLVVKVHFYSKTTTSFSSFLA